MKAGPWLLTVEEVAERLRTSRSHVYSLIQSRSIAVHRVGSGRRAAVRISEVDLQTFLEKCRTDVADEKPRAAARKLKHLRI